MLAGKIAEKMCYDNADGSLGGQIFLRFLNAKITLKKQTKKNTQAGPVWNWKK